MLTDTRYFTFNHEAAFAGCQLNGLRWNGTALCAAGGADSAMLVTPILDSGVSGNVWQRVVADVIISDGGRIVWRLFASDVKGAIDNALEAFTIENADDFLTIGVCGRYLRLAVEISGSAEIRSMMIYQSWESFLDYLPEIYRDYNGFSDRFLRLFAAQYLDLEKRINDLPGTFDPAVAPPDTLRWLAELVGVRHINLWETDGLRRLLTSGVYRRRGQFSVFADYIEYFSGYKPYIAEHFRYLTGIPENDRMYTGGDVTVFLPPEAAGLNEEALYAVIDDFLPGDIVCRVVMLDPYPVVSSGAILGLNTHVGRYEQTVVGTARVGITVIGDDL